MSNEISTERAVCVPGNVTKGFEAAVAGILALHEQDYRIHEKSLPGQMGWAYVKSLVFHFFSLLQLQGRPGYPVLTQKCCP